MAMMVATANRQIDAVKMTVILSMLSFPVVVMVSSVEFASTILTSRSSVIRERERERERVKTLKEFLKLALT